jgi:hypothetical protein
MTETVAKTRQARVCNNHGERDQFLGRSPTELLACLASWCPTRW